MEENKFIKVRTLVKGTNKDYSKALEEWMEESEKHKDLYGQVLDAPDIEEFSTWEPAIVDITNVVNGTSSILTNDLSEVVLYYTNEDYHIVSGTLKEWEELIKEFNTLEIYDGPKTICTKSK